MPKNYHSLVRQRLNVAWGMTSYSEAKKSLLRVVEYLETISQSAANSLREGLEETLTLHRLNASPGLRKVLSTTNPIESCFSRSRDLLRNVKAWKNEDMACRWAAAVFLQAEKKFRKIKGFREIPLLIGAMRKGVDAQAGVG